MEAWRQMSAAELGRAIGAGEIDPEALAETFLSAIRAHPMGARVYARLTETRAGAEAAAAAARARGGLRRSALDGVPLSWKDLFDTSGTVTEAGSRLLQGRIPDRDAEVLANATAVGTVCLGKTHMTELAFSGLGINPMTATPPNAVDPPRAPGGSSSGAAVSVALGLAPAAVGSDTGGSVRLPAAWNDIVGMKTTHGRVSLTGVVPLVASFDTVGPLARTVEDAALLLAALEGRPPADLRGARMDGSRLAVLATVALDGVRAEPQAGFDRALDALRDAGAVIETIDAPEVAEAMDLAGALFTAEAWAIWGETIEAHPDLMYAPIRERFASGAAFSAAQNIRAWRRLASLRAAWAERSAGFDAVLVPTSPILPPDAARLLADSSYFVAENLLALRNTRIGNLMGLCGLTLPTGVPMTGLQLMGSPMAEERLLRLGHAAERALGQDG